MSFDYLVLGAGGIWVKHLGYSSYTILLHHYLWFLLKKFAWGPLMGIMTQREELVASEIEAAENSRKESQRLLEEQRDLLKKHVRKHKRLLKMRRNKAKQHVKKLSQLLAMKQSV